MSRQKIIWQLRACNFLFPSLYDWKRLLFDMLFPGNGNIRRGGVLPLLYTLLLSHKVFQTSPGILRHGTLKTNGGLRGGGSKIKLQKSPQTSSFLRLHGEEQGLHSQHRAWCWQSPCPAPDPDPERDSLSVQFSPQPLAN